jgi:hypothetical protein
MPRAPARCQAGCGDVVDAVEASDPALLDELALQVGRAPQVASWIVSWS